MRSANFAKVERGTFATLSTHMLSISRKINIPLELVNIKYILNNIRQWSLYMYAPSKHTNTKSSSWLAMMMSQNRVIAVGLEILFYTVDTNVSQSCLTSTFQTCNTLSKRENRVGPFIRTDKTYRNRPERDWPGWNVLLSVIDRWLKRSSPSSLREH